MRRLEQRNKVKKLADTERTKNNSEEKGEEEAKNEEDRDDWARERGRNETDTSRGMEKKMVGEARYARDGKPQVEERVEGWHEDWSHLVCS